MNAKTQLQEVQVRLTQLDPNNRDNLVEIASLKTQESELAKQAEAEEEQAAREQKTGELLDEYNDTLNNIFDGLFPEKVYSVLLGAAEYVQLRQDYKRVHHAYHSGQIEKINADHAAEIESWREKFGRLTAQAQDVENQLAESKRLVDELTEEVNDSGDRIVSLERTITEHIDVIANLHEMVEKGNAAERENVRLRQEIVELEAKLEQSQKPKEPAKTEAVDNLLNEIKSRKQMDPDEMMRRFEARQNNGPKVMAIDHGAKNPELSVLPFRLEVATPVLEQSTGPLSLVTEEQFRGGLAESEGQQAVRSDDAGVPGIPTDTETVSRSEFKALEARVKAIEGRFTSIDNVDNGAVA